MKEVECNNYGCGKTALEHQLPEGWIRVREVVGRCEYKDTFYCSHECLRVVENDD